LEDETNKLQVLDFGAARDGIPENKRGHRIVVDPRGREIEDVEAQAETAAGPAAGGQ
jgi:F-box and WD-40 domain protein CDC4